MVQPSKFKAIEFEWDEYNLEEVLDHRISPEEVEECFFNKHKVYRNKKRFGRRYDTFKLEGRTDNGKQVLVIFFIKEKTTVRSIFGSTALIRVITAWEGK